MPKAGMDVSEKAVPRDREVAEQQAENGVGKTRTTSPVLMEPMMKTASFALTVLLLTAPAAFAQTTTTTPADKPAASTAAADGQFYSHQAGEIRASKLIGTNVTNAANESVGEINDVVLGKDGKIAAVIIGVGGFLGLGEHDVAVSYSGLKFAKDSSNRDVITINATKDQLKAAPAWKWDNTTR